MLEKGSRSTAIGHGLVDPKIRGKPVSHANKAGRVLRSAGARPGTAIGSPRGEPGEGPGRPLWGGGMQKRQKFLDIRPQPNRKGIRSIFRNQKGGSKVAAVLSLAVVEGRALAGGQLSGGACLLAAAGGGDGSYVAFKRRRRKLSLGMPAVTLRRDLFSS